jgi:hypothetical protein
MGNHPESAGNYHSSLKREPDPMYIHYEIVHTTLHPNSRGEDIGSCSIPVTPVGSQFKGRKPYFDPVIKQADSSARNGVDRKQYQTKIAFIGDLKVWISLPHF